MTMERQRGSSLLAGLALAVMLSLSVAAQQPAANSLVNTKPSPNATPSAKTDPEPAQTPAATTEPDIWSRETLTGDWDGVRKKWEEHGIGFELSWTNFFQGTATGGLENEAAYGGKLTGVMTLDTTKAGWWKSGKFLLKVDNRYHDSASEFTGALLPVNTALLGPKEDGTATAITALNYTHIFPLSKPGDLVLVSVGRFDILDQITEPLLGGAGETKFMNINQVAPPHEARNVPLVTWGAVWAWVRKGEPFFSVAMLDSADSSTIVGLRRVFEKGVTIMPALTYVTHFGGKAGHQGIRATWSNQTVTPFDQLRRVILPLPNRPVQPKTGSWSVTYSFDQYFHEVPGYPRKGWGVFGQLGFADRRTSPIQTFVNIGIAGNSPFKSRPRDNFGVAYAFDSISGDLKDALDPIARLRDEHEFEAFYNLAITPWLYLTGDVQVVRPARPAASTAFVPGVRMRVLF
jgi:porin